MTQFEKLPNARWGRLGYIIIVASLALVLLATVRDLNGYHFSISPWPLAASIALAFSTVFALFLAWYWLLVRVSGQPVPWLEAIRIFAYSWLGRYVPGRVWSSVGKVYVGGRLGLSVEELTLASVLEQVFSNLAHVLLALFFLFFLFSGEIGNPLILISIGLSLAGAGLLVLQPTILRRLVNLILRRLGRRSLDTVHFPGNRESIFFVLGYTVPLLLYGGSFWLVVEALSPTTDASLIDMISAFTIGSFVGKLAFVVPAGGIGVREAALVIILQPMIGLPQAVLASLISRLGLVLVDLAFVCMVFGIDRIVSVNGRHSPAAAR
jgi:uncharacterized membrane protein YbhN (UPF0104 family)